MAQRKNLIPAFVAIATVLTLLGLIIFGVGVQAQEDGGQTQAKSVSDSLGFRAEFQAGEKPRELVSQYASISINGSEETVYSTDAEGLLPSGHGCVFAGLGESCRGSGEVSSAATDRGGMDPVRSEYELLGLLGLTWVEGSVDAPIATSARCYLDENSNPTGKFDRPSGTIRYGGNALLGENPDLPLDLQKLEDDQPLALAAETAAISGLGGTLRVEVEAEADFDWDPVNLRAHSEVEITYRTIKAGSVEDEESFTARSECGMLMSDGTGSSSPEGEQAQSLASPQAFGLADPENTETSDPESSPTPAPNDDQPTTAPGTPQQSGFTDESSLTTANDVDYHLLSTRELDLLDREVIADVLTATRETGAVQGETATARWWLYSAEAADGEVPVLEIELADGAIVQARPNLPGVQYPTPDLTISATPTTTTGQPSEPTAEQTSEPATEQSTTSQMPAAPEETGEEAADE